MTSKTFVFIGMLAFTTLAGCDWLGGRDGENTAPIDTQSNQVILTWSTVAEDAAVADDGYATPLQIVRMLSIMHLAQHDALSAIKPAFAPYAYYGADPDADPVAAAASAAHAVLTATYPDQESTFDAQLALSLEGVADEDARERGVALGAEAAEAVLEARANDGSDTPTVGDYVPGDGPGRYQFVPPFDFAALPGWRNLRPFALTTPDQFRSDPPPALDSDAYAADYNEVKSIGEADSPTRSDDELASAVFWNEFSDRGWNRIARVVASERELGLQSTARLFALLNMAMSDSYVAGWDSKYYYDFWRPYTAIRAADTDGNALTAPDPEWETAIMTPPVQDYPSTHSALGNAAASVLGYVFGDETSFSFTSTSAEPPYSSRSFTSFSQAADENANSRVMGGIHFRFACNAGQQLGDKVGEFTIANYLRAK